MKNLAVSTHASPRSSSISTKSWGHKMKMPKKAQSQTWCGVSSMLGFFLVQTSLLPLSSLCACNKFSQRELHLLGSYYQSKCDHLNLQNLLHCRVWLCDWTGLNHSLDGIIEHLLWFLLKIRLHFGLLLYCCTASAHTLLTVIRSWWPPIKQWPDVRSQGFLVKDQTCTEFFMHPPIR